MVSVILLSRGSYKCLAAASCRMTTYGHNPAFRCVVGEMSRRRIHSVAGHSIIEGKSSLSGKELSCTR